MSWLDSSPGDPAFDNSINDNPVSPASLLGPPPSTRITHGPASSPDLLQFKQSSSTRTKEDIGELFSLAQATLPPKAIKKTPVVVSLPPGPKPATTSSSISATTSSSSVLASTTSSSSSSILASTSSSSSVVGPIISPVIQIAPPIAPKPAVIAAPSGIKPSITSSTISQVSELLKRVSELEATLEKEKSLRVVDARIQEESLNTLRVEFADKEQSLLSVISTKEKDVRDRDEAISRGRAALTRLKEAGMAAQQRVVSLELELEEARRLPIQIESQLEPASQTLVESLRSELEQAYLQVNTLKGNIIESNKSHENVVSELKDLLNDARENANVAAAAAAAAAASITTQDTQKAPRANLLSRATAGLIRRVSTTLSTESSVLAAAATAASAAAIVNSSTVEIPHRGSRASSYGSQEGVAIADVMERDSLELRIRLGSAMAKIADLESKAQMSLQLISAEKTRADSTLERLHAQMALRESAFEQLASLQSENSQLLVTVKKLSEEAVTRSSAALSSSTLTSSETDNEGMELPMSKFELSRTLVKEEERARLAEDTVLTLQRTLKALESRAIDAEESLSTARAAAGRSEAAGESAEAESRSLREVIRQLENEAKLSSLRYSDKCKIEEELIATLKVKDSIEKELRVALMATAEDSSLKARVDSSLSSPNPQTPLKQSSSLTPDTAEIILELESRIARLKSTGQARIDALKMEVANLQQSQSSLISQLKDETLVAAEIKENYSRVVAELRASQESAASAKSAYQSEINVLKANLDEISASTLRMRTTGQARIDSLKEEVSNLKAQLEISFKKSSSELDLVKAEAKSFEEKLLEAQESLSKTMKLVAESTRNRLNAEQSAEAANLKMKELEDSNSSANEMVLKETKSRLSSSEAAVSSLNESLATERQLGVELKSRLSSSEAAVSSLNESLATERQLGVELKSRLSSSEAAVSSLNESLATERQLGVELKSRLSSSEAAVSSLNESLATERQLGSSSLSSTLNRLRQLETLQVSNDVLQAKSDTDLKRLQKEVDSYKTNFSELVDAGVKKAILEQQRSVAVAASGFPQEDEIFSPSLDRKASSFSQQSHHSSTPQERNQMIILETDNFMMAAAIKRLEQQIDELKTENSRLSETLAKSVEEIKFEAEQRLMAAKLEAASLADAAVQRTTSVEQIIIEASDERGAAQLAIASALSARDSAPSLQQSSESNISSVGEFSSFGVNASNEILRLQAESSTLQADVIRLQYEILGLEETLAHNQAHAQSALEEALSVASTMRAERNDLLLKIRKAEVDLENSSRREDSMKISVAALEDKIREEQERLSGNAAFASIDGESKNEMIQIAASREEAVEGEYIALAALEASEARVTSLTNQLAKSRAEVRSASEEHAATIAEFNEVLQQVSTAVEQSSSLREEAKQAVAANARLEEQLAAAVIAKNDALKELELSEGSKTEDTAFLRSLLGESRIVAAQAVATSASLEAQKAASLRQIATLAAAVEDADAGRLGNSGGISQGLLSTLLGHQRDAAGLKAEVCSLKKFMVTARDELEKAGSVLKDFEALKVERNESIAAKEALEIEKEHLLSTLEELTERADHLESECSALKLGQKVSMDITTNAQKSAEELALVVSNLLAELDHARSSLAKAQTRAQVAEIEIARISNASSFLSEEKKDNEEEVFTLQVEVERLKENEEIARLERESAERESNAAIAAIELELAVLKKSILESDQKKEAEKTEAVSLAAETARDEAIGTINEVISALQTDSDEKVSRLRSKLKTSEALAVDLKTQLTALQSESGRTDELINAIFELKTDLDALTVQKNVAEESVMRFETAIKRANSILRGESLHGNDTTLTASLPSTTHEQALAAAAILDAALSSKLATPVSIDGNSNIQSFQKSLKDQHGLYEELELWKSGTASVTPADAAVRFMTLAQSLNGLSAELENRISQHDKLIVEYEACKRECASLASDSLESRTQYEALLAQLPSVRDEFKRLEAEKDNAFAMIQQLKESTTILSSRIVSLEKICREKEELLEKSVNEIAQARLTIFSLESIINSQSFVNQPQRNSSPAGLIRDINDVPFSALRPSALDSSMRAAEVALPTSPVASLSTAVSPSAMSVIYQSPPPFLMPSFPLAEGNVGGALASTPAATAAISQLQRQLREVQQQRDSLRVELNSLARSAVGAALSSPTASAAEVNSNRNLMSSPPTIRNIYVRSASRPSPLSTELSPPPSPTGSNRKVDDFEVQISAEEALRPVSKSLIIDSLRQRIELLEIESKGSPTLPASRHSSRDNPEAKK